MVGDASPLSRTLTCRALVVLEAEVSEGGREGGEGKNGLGSSNENLKASNQ